MVCLGKKIGERNFHRPTEQILHGDQVYLYQGFSKIKSANSAGLFVLYQGGVRPRPRSDPPLVQNEQPSKICPKNNQAKFARLDGELQSPNQGTHPETLLRERGFSLGFRSTLPSPGQPIAGQPLCARGSGVVALVGCARLLAKYRAGVAFL